MKKDEIDHLVKITFNYISNNDINPNDTNVMKKISRNKNSVFSDICLQLIGEIDYNKVLRFRQMWIRNTNGKATVEI